jgi:hypothetical protein
MYRTLSPDKIIHTIKQLENRISAGFPGRGLGMVCSELLDVAVQSKERTAAAVRPNLLLRGAIVLVLALGIMLLFYVATIIEVKRSDENLFGVLQGIDSAVNTLVLTGAGVFFLATLESRWKRQLMLADLHELQTIVHVIDMHQLSKDPDDTVGGVETPARAASDGQLTPRELMHYLDYCSEMLSLAAKVAALYAQASRDPVVIDAATAIEQLTSNLSSKMWQKITLSQEIAEARASSPRLQARPPHTGS